MIIAISATKEGMQSPVDPRFGRCPGYVLFNEETEAVSYLENQAASMSSGAGIQAAQAVAGSGAEVVLTGQVGPKAYQTLSAAGIKIVPGATGTVGEALMRYRKGDLQPTAGPTGPAHFGMGKGAGQGRGMGRGGSGMGGMGRGRGRR